MGLAYQLNDKTVIRTAYGIAFIPTTQNSPSQLGFSSSTALVTSNDGGRTPANTLSNPYPTGLTAPTGSSLGALRAVGASVSAQLFDVHRGYTQRWNFNVQRQFFGNWLFEVGYVGNRGVHLFMYNQNLNWLPDSVLSSPGWTRPGLNGSTRRPTSAV